MVLAMLLSLWLILQSPLVQTYLVGKITARLSEKLHADISVRGVSIAFFNKVVLKGVLIRDQQHDSLLFVHRLVATVDSFSLKKRYVALGHLKLDETFVNVYSDSTGRCNYQFLADSFASSDTVQSTDTTQFNFRMNRFDFDDARVKYACRDSLGNHRIDLNHITLGVSGLKIHRQDVAFEITRFQLENSNDFRLEQCSAFFRASSDSVSLTKLHLKTSESEISEANIRIDKRKFGQHMNFAKLKLDSELKKSSFSLKEVGLFVPQLKGMTEKIQVSGEVSGTLDDLKGKNIELSMGKNTRLNLDAYLNGLPDIANMYMHIDLKKSYADLRELSRVRLPDVLGMEYFIIPQEFIAAGVVEYTGNFTGFLSDFVAYGTFKSKLGVVRTDLSFVPSGGDMLKINGRVKTIGLLAGPLTGTDLVGPLSFDGTIRGTLNQNSNDFSAEVVGRIDSIEINQYQYRNIDLNGDIKNKQFDGRLIVDDPNLKMQFDGKFNLNVPVPIFNFDLMVENANLKAMNLDHSFAQSNISFALDANFTGNNIDNLAGFIHFRKGSYQNENGLLTFDNFDLKTSYENEPVLQVRSDFFDADIRGQYELHSLANSVKKIWSHYLPSAGIKPSGQSDSNNFDFSLNLKDINRFTRVLLPDLMIDPAKIEGNISSERNTLVVNATFPHIHYKTAVLSRFSLVVQGNSELMIHNKIEEVSLGSSFKIYNLALNANAAADVLDSKLSWNNFGQVSYSGSLSALTRFYPQKNYPHVEVALKPSRIFVGDSLWQVNPALVTIDSTHIGVNNVSLSSKGQSVRVEGSVALNQDDKLNVHFQKIDLNALNDFVPGDLELAGELNGSVSLFNVYKQALFLSDLKISDFGMLGQLLGNATVQTQWDTNSESINARLRVDSENRRTLDASGIYNPGKDSLSIHTNFDHFSILILQPLLGSGFDRVHGTATGKVWVHGSPDHIMHDGALYAENAGLMLTDLAVNYNLSDSVRFRHDKIIFPDITIADEFGNTGVFSGSIQHQSFSKMIYDMTVRTRRLMVINTTPEINEQFFGKAFASGVVRITGKGITILISGSVRTEKGTEMNIALQSTSDVAQYDFLTFVTHGYHPPARQSDDDYDYSDVQMKFEVNITPDAKMQLVYNSKVGDVIKSQGAGTLQVSIDKNFNILLYGTYTFEQGDYLFTLQNVINKKFDIQQGGTIEWNGNPYDATLNLNAVYRLKASLGDLFASTYQNIDTQRIPVLCKIQLTKSLNNPDIKFDIELPTVQDQIREGVRQYINTDEDMNRQMLSLLVLGKFYTPEYLRVTYTAPNNNLAGTTASELLSNQLSNWLSQISNDVNVGVNYRPGNQITNDEIELAMSTQIFNNRVTINGNIGNNTSQRTSANNNGLVGDADINVKLTRNGKLQMKAYNHANNNLIYETSPYTQGVGLTYREDFNNFKELWRKLTTVFRKKKRTETTPGGQ
jgi:hypothetical protein